MLIFFMIIPAASPQSPPLAADDWVKVLSHLDLPQQQFQNGTVNDKGNGYCGDENYRERPRLGGFGERRHDEPCVSGQQQEEGQHGNEDVE